MSTVRADPPPVKVSSATVRWIILALAFMLAACQYEPGGADVPLPPGADDESVASRTLVDGEWDTIAVVGNSVEDSLLRNPFWIAADTSGFYVFDGSDQRLIAFSRDGRLRWTLGSVGKGPNEFTVVRDIGIGPQGKIHLLDVENSRRVVVEPNGTIVQSSPIRTHNSAHQVVPLSQQRFALTTISPRPIKGPIVVMDSAGEVQSTPSIPWEGHNDLPGLSAILLTAHIPNRQLWVAGYQYGSGWYLYRDTVPLSGPYPYVEPVAFPKPDQRGEGPRRSYRLPPGTIRSAADMKMVADTLHVLAGNVDDAPFRVLDRYDISTGTYLNSRRLPVRASAFAADGSRVYLVRRNPVPAVFVLEK